MFCNKCGKEIPNNSKFCKFCGNTINSYQSVNYNANTNNTVRVKKKMYQQWWFWLIIVFLIIGIVGMSMGGNESKEVSSNEQQKIEQKPNKEKIIYNKNNILIKITDYRYRSITGTLEVEMYIENNSKQDLQFIIDGDVTLNDYTVDTYFYETVNKGTKSSKSFTLYNLNDNKIKENDLSSMKFKMDIYHSDNYYIDDKIEEDYKIEYKF